MPNVTPGSTNANESQPRQRGRLWPWFVAGFVLVFIGLAAIYPREFYDGQSVHRTWLWHYYLLEIQLASNSTGNLGPTSGNSAVALEVVLIHLLFSTVGGAVMTGIGWFVRK